MKYFINHKSQDKIFMAYFRPYLLIVLLIFTIVVSILFVTLLNEYSYQKSKIEDQIENTAKTIDKEIEIIYNSMSMINESDQFLDAVSNSNYYSFHKLQDYLGLHGVTNTFVNEIFVTVKGSDYITSSISVYQTHYPVFMHNNHDMLKDSLVHIELLDSGMHTAVKNGAEYLMISRSYPVNTTNADDTAVVFFAINGSEFQQLFSEEYIVSFSIINRNGTDIFETSVADEVDEHSFSVTGIYKDTYVFGYNADIAYQNFYERVVIYILVALLLLVIMFFSAFLLAKVRVKPIKELARVCGIVETNNTKIDNLFSYASDIISEDLKRNQLFVDNLPALQRTFYNRLIKNDFLQQENIDKRIKFLNFPITNSMATIFIIKFEELDDYVEAKRVTISAIGNLFENTFIKEEGRSGSSIEILINLNEKFNLTLLKEKGDELHCYILNNHGINTKIGIGNPCNNLFSLYLSHESAEKCINSKMTESCSVITYENSSPETAVYVYPSEIQSELCNAVLKESRQEIDEVFSRILLMNQHITPHTNMYYLLLRDMLTTFIKILQTARTSYGLEVDSIEDDIKLITNKIEQPNSYEILSSLFYLLNENLQDIKGDKDMAFKLKLIECIENNYTSNQFSLSMISQELGVPEYLISKKFKSFFGIKFSEYVEELRMSYAKKLINETEKSINTIAKEVGYSGAVSFRRAYKRHFNKLPRD